MKTAAGIEADRREGQAQVFGKSIRVEQHLEDDGPPQRIRTVIPFQLKSLNDEERTIQFVGSTNAVDRYGDVIEQNWELANFIKNPVVPWGHDYSMPPVAKALEVGYTNGALTFTAQFATSDEYAWADTIYKMYKGGYLRAFSVGFMPIEYEGNFTDGYTFTKCELLEVSCVTVPANPEALVLAIKEGVLSEAERKSMIANAEKVIKTLTDSANSEQNEDMETAKAIKELTGVMVEVRDLLKEAKLTKAEEVEPEGDGEGEVEPEGQEPEGAESDKPADEPAGGADDDKDEAEAKGVKLTADEIRQAVKGGVKKELDYRLGKIN